MKLQEKFNVLEDMLLSKRETIGVHTGTPFILLIYDPKIQNDCKNEIKNLTEKLSAHNLKVLEISVGKFIFESLEKDDRLEQVFEYERESPEEVKEELTNRCKHYIKDWILEKINAEMPVDVVFLTDVAGLHPYYRVSAILDSLENEIKIPFIVFYPGMKKENDKLYFLGEYESSEYYRARRII